jgi:hypothetical protein
MHEGRAQNWEGGLWNVDSGGLFMRFTRVLRGPSGTWFIVNICLYS